MVKTGKAILKWAQQRARRGFIPLQRDAASQRIKPFFASVPSGNRTEILLGRRWKAEVRPRLVGVAVVSLSPILPSLPLLLRSPSSSSSRLARSHRLLFCRRGSRWPPLSMALSCCDLTAIKCRIKVMGRHCRSAEADGTQWIIVMERMMSWLLAAAPSSIFICRFKKYIYMRFYICICLWWSHASDSFIIF